MVPFKVEQLFSHIFFSSMTNEQINSAKKKLEEFLFDRLSFEEFVDSLDKNIDEKGAGLGTGARRKVFLQKRK